MRIQITCGYFPHLPQSRIRGMRLRVSMHKGGTKKSDYWAPAHELGTAIRELGSL